MCFVCVGAATVSGDIVASPPSPVLALPAFKTQLADFTQRVLRGEDIDLGTFWAALVPGTKQRTIAAGSVHMLGHCVGFASVRVLAQHASEPYTSAACVSLVTRCRCTTIRHGSSTCDAVV